MITTARMHVIRPPVLKEMYRGERLAKSFAGETIFAAIFTETVAMRMPTSETIATMIRTGVEKNAWEGEVMTDSKYTGSQRFPVTSTSTSWAVLVMTMAMALNTSIVVGNPNVWPRIWSRWLRPKRVKSGMFNASVAQLPIAPSERKRSERSILDKREESHRSTKEQRSPRIVRRSDTSRVDGASNLSLSLWPLARREVPQREWERWALPNSRISSRLPFHNRWSPHESTGTKKMSTNWEWRDRERSTRVQDVRSSARRRQRTFSELHLRDRHWSQATRKSKETLSTAIQRVDDSLHRPQAREVEQGH